MKNKIILFLFMAMVLAYSASAVEVILTNPVNATTLSTSTVTYGVNVIGGNTSNYECILYTNENASSGIGGWVAHETRTINNNSAENYSNNLNVATIEGTNYLWSVYCNSSLDPNGAWASNVTLSDSSIVPLDGNATFGVDTVSPVVGILATSPTSDEWLLSGLLNIGLQVNDTNADRCVLYSTINGTDNTTQPWGVSANNSYTNATTFNFTQFGGVTTNVADNGTGEYYWNYVCTDNAGNEATLSSNITFFVDTVDPGVFYWNSSKFKTSPGGYSLINDSTSTDYTPQLGWNETVEANFSRYTIGFYNDSGYVNLSVEKNITSISEILTNMTELPADKAMYILITAYDLAGRGTNISDADFKYTTSSICHSLSSGWNICGILGNNKSMSQLMNETSATTVSYLNTSDNTFASHVSDGSNADVVIPSGDAVFLYMGSAGTWQDSVENVSKLSGEVTITNQSNTDWNIVVVTNKTYDDSFQDVDYLVNGNGTAVLGNNVSYFSLYNNTASSGNKHIPFVNNLTFNNATEVKFGDTIWMYVNASFSTVNVNWNRRNS